MMQISEGLMRKLYLLFDLKNNSNMKYFYYIVIGILTFSSCKNISFEEEQNIIDDLNKKSWNYKYNNPDSALFYATKALNNAALINYKTGLSEAYNNLGYTYFLRSQFFSADTCFQRSLEFNSNYLEKTLSYIGRAKIAHRTCNYISYHKYLEKAESNFGKATKLIFKNERINLIKTEFHILKSSYLYYKREMNSAYKEIKKISYENLNDLNQIAYIEYMLGCCASKDLALSHYLKSLQISKENNNL